MDEHLDPVEQGAEDLEQALYADDLDRALRIAESVDRALDGDGDLGTALDSLIDLARELDNIERERAEDQWALEINAEVAKARDADARRGRKVRQGAEQGGRTRRGARAGRITDADLCQKVLERHRTHPKDSWSAVCRHVGSLKGVGVSGRTVQRRASSVDWRP